MLIWYGEAELKIRIFVDHPPTIKIGSLIPLCNIEKNKTMIYAYTSYATLVESEKFKTQHR